ncbi:GlsB/YeaQ/YmgE family stress response membrane protein [Sphingomonas sp.]|uniref:GlsB/YeaQ/YmgE family stress response membrane protein n=1 Tax=Sphingomonas sp. TaxID=28214 RepID=UPI003751AA50
MVLGLIIWLVIGGICGWLASLIMRTDGQQGIILNVIVGIVGSVIANLIFNREGLNAAPLSVTAFLWSLLGAVILLAIVNLVRRGKVR